MHACETTGFSYLDEIDEGWAIFSWAILGMFWVDGSGTLANVEFEVLEIGESKLDLVTEPVWSEHAQTWVYMTHLTRINPPPIPVGGKEMEDIPFTAIDGYFNDQLCVWLYDQLMALNSSYYSLLAEYQDLLDKYDNLESDYSSLNATYISLLDNYTQLQTDHGSLQSQFDNLNDSYNELDTDYDTLQDSYNSLENAYLSLNSIYNSLEADYDDLESKYETGTGELGTARNLSYLLIMTTAVFIVSTAYLLLRKPRVKPT